MAACYMLDTNTVSHLIRGNTAVRAQFQKVSMAELCISAITEGELRFGCAKRPESQRLHAIVREFLSRLDILPWDSAAAEAYGALRASLEGEGRGLGNLDMLIAAHAISAGATLVTNDAALRKLKHVDSVDWT
jgi:tRNA(fMet)-specific endonuclease VapC